MDWEAIRAEMSRATGRPPEAIPHPQTPEFYALITKVGERDPALARAITDALVRGIDPPVPTHKELTDEARRAGLRERLLRPFVKQDPTQPRRSRVNRTTTMAVMAVGFVALLWSFQIRSYHTPVRAAHGPVQMAQADPSPPPSPKPATPLMAPPLPSLPIPTLSLPLPPPLGNLRGSLPPSSGGGRDGPTGLQIVAPAPAQEEAHLTVVAGVAGQATGAGPSVHLQIGDQFTVTLTTPLAVSPGWPSIPALAVAQDGPLEGWKIVGQASLAQDGTPQISWDQALSPDGRVTMPIHGVAFNPKNGIPGVAGARSVPMAPQAARTVLSGTLAAVGQYVNAQVEAQQVQVSGITATLTTQVPPFWQFVASQVATGFQPAPVQTGGIVVVSQMPAGMPIAVLITAPAQPHAGVADRAARHPG